MLPNPKAMSFWLLDVHDTRLFTVSGMQRQRDQMKFRTFFEILCFWEIRVKLPLGLLVNLLRR